MVEGSSEGPFVPRDGGGQDCWQQPHRVSGCGLRFFLPSFCMDGAVRSNEKTFPKTTVGWWWGWEKRRWGFSPSSSWKIRLQSIKETVTGHPEHDQGPRLMERGMRVFVPPAALASSLAGLATSVSMSGNVGGCGHPGNAGEPSGLGR